MLVHRQSLCQQTKTLTAGYSGKVDTQKPQLKEILDSNGDLLAIIVSFSDFGSGVHFVTPNDLQQQVAVMKRASGEEILPHTHLPVPRSIRGTQEVLIVLGGSIKADIYDSSERFVKTEILESGHVITLVSGGHGFTVLEDAQFIEVKQGPYVPGSDKKVFSPDSKSA